MMKQFGKSGTGKRRYGKTARRDLIEVGSKIHDRGLDRTGVILDYACQYTHPQAQPIYNYLIRWQDGQIQAISEVAFASGHGLDTVD